MQIAFDGMRKHLAEDFDAIYILDLGGNVRRNPKLSGTTHNVFGIQVGVSINSLLGSRTSRKRRCRSLTTPRSMSPGSKEQKYAFLDGSRPDNSDVLDWNANTLTRNLTWLTRIASQRIRRFLP